MSQRRVRSSVVSKAQALSEATSSCGHQTEDGGPCSRCQPPVSWVSKGWIPKKWRHMPWDDVEMRKHGAIPDHDEAGLDERPNPSIEEALKRSVRLGQVEVSIEVENWPLVKISSKTPESPDEDEDPSPAAKAPESPYEDEDPSPVVKPFALSATDEEGSSPFQTGRSSSGYKRKSKKSRGWRSKTIVSKGESRKFVIPLKRGKRARTVEVDLNVRVRIQPRKAADSGRSEGEN